MRKLLLLEMIARVIKDILRAQMRAKMREVKVLSEEPFKEVTLFLILLICSFTFYSHNIERENNKSSIAVPSSNDRTLLFVTVILQVVTKVFSLILGRSEKSEKFWSLVKARLVKKFHNALSKEEEEEQGSLQDKIDIGFLFTRLQELVGVRLTQEARQELEVPFIHIFIFPSQCCVDLTLKFCITLFIFLFLLCFSFLKGIS